MQIQLSFVFLSLIQVFFSLYIAAYSEGSVFTFTLFYLLDVLFFVALVLSVALEQFSTYGAEIRSPSARLPSLLSWAHLFEGLSLIPIELLSAHLDLCMRQYLRLV